MSADVQSRLQDCVNRLIEFLPGLIALLSFQMQLGFLKVNFGARNNLIDPGFRLLKLGWDGAGRRTRRYLGLYDGWSKKRPDHCGTSNPTGESNYHQSLFSFTSSGESTTAGVGRACVTITNTC